MKRPIFWGLIGAVVGVLGWVVCVVLSVVTLGKFRVPANIFAYLAIASILYGVLGEMIRWLSRGKPRS